MVVSLIKSMPNDDRYQIILCDDGSSPTLESFCSKNNFSCTNIVYVRNSTNVGRINALKIGMKKASGKVSMIMDSDDFIHSSNLVEFLNYLETLNSYNKALILGQKIDYHTHSFKIEFKENKYPSVIQLRIDLAIKQDLREVVPTDLLQEAFQSLDNTDKRIPTAILWLYISNKIDAISLPFLITTKRYLEDGLTKNITSIKRKNPGSMLNYYWKLLFSPCYKSWKYRMQIAVKIMLYSSLLVLKKVFNY
jgi:glycosyltransferase involved in cell wall biosynthesis